MKLVIFGCGKIAHRIAKGALLADNCELVGFASRDVEKAKEYSQQYGCKKYGDYNYFFNSDVDAIYLATYTPGHYELIKECLNHHKHVICEKPMVNTIEKNDELFELAKTNGVLLMEAMKAVFLPINQKIKQMINDGVIGEVQYIEASYAKGSDFRPEHWINDLQCGGALRDLGSYCAGIMNFLMDKKPVITYKKTDRGEIADRFAEVCVDYDGISGHIVASNSVTTTSALTVSGTKGVIYVPDFWKASKGYCYIDGQRTELNEEMLSDFYYEIRHFAELVDNKKLASPIMSKEASDNILIITE